MAGDGHTMSGPIHSMVLQNGINEVVGVGLLPLLLV